MEVFSQKFYSFRVYIFRSVVHFKLIFVCGLRYGSKFSAPWHVGMQPFQHRWLERLSLLHWVGLGAVVGIICPHTAGLSLGFVSLICFSVLTPALQCLDHSGFVRSLQVGAEFPNFVLALLSALCFRMNFRISVSVFQKHFYWDCIESVNQFGENWHNSSEHSISPFIYIFYNFLLVMFCSFQCTGRPYLNRFITISCFWHNFKCFYFSFPSVLVCKNTILFCMFILCTKTLLNSSILIFWEIFSDFLHRNKLIACEWKVLPLYTQSGCIQFLFLALLPWLKPPVQCWPEVERVSVFALSCLQ